MSLFKPTETVIVYSFFFVLFVVAIRKLTYQLYNWFPNAARVCEFGRKRKVKFYWADRVNFSTFELIRLYTLWIMLRFDKYFPVVDCERQAAKAQYFHMSGRYTGMSGWHFRYVNPKAWPVFFMRSFAIFLFPSLFNPRDRVIDKFKTEASGYKADDKFP